MITTRTELLLDIKFSANFVSFLHLNPENWSDRIDSGMPCVSMHDLKNFNVHFPLVELVTFTEGNFENLYIATRR